jgi:hypothetical protein
MNRLSSLGFCLLGIATAGLGSSCVADLELEEQIASNQVMSFEEFEARTYREAETGVYIVDGDTPLEDIEQLREFHARLIQGGLAVHQANGADARWDGFQKLELTYCVSTNFGARYDAMRQIMREATRAWEAAARIDFIHLESEDTRCSALNSRVVFDVRQVSGEPYLARAFFPNYARANRNILVDTAAYGNMAPYTLTGILRHELGHVLGFRHEHTRPEAGVCFEDREWRPLTPYDGSSVMHYPWCNGTNSGDLMLTPYDKQGARVLYGAWPHRLLSINRGGQGGRLMITDFSDGTPPPEVVYRVDWGEGRGDSDLLEGWHDANDAQLAGDFMGLGHDQVMFINRSSAGGRILIASFREGQAAQLHYVEAYGQSTVLDGWHDPNDRMLVGDFMGLGHDQVMFINRSGGGGRVLIADFSHGVAPVKVRYLEVWGQSAVLDGWHDDSDLAFAGDFMNLSHDQVLFINRSGGGGRVLVADFSAGSAPARARYFEVWGQSELLDTFHDQGDLQMVGDFMNLGYEQVMFINRSGGGGRVMITDFSAGVAPATALYREAWGQSTLLDGWLDENDLRFAGDFMGLGYEQVMFINRSGGGGKIMVVDFSAGVAPALVRYLEVWGQSAVLDGWLDENDVQIVGDFRGK